MRIFSGLLYIARHYLYRAVFIPGVILVGLWSFYRGNTENVVYCILGLVFLIWGASTTKKVW